MEKTKAKVSYSFLRIFSKFLMEIQRSWIIPYNVRKNLLRCGGVKIGNSFVGRDVSFDTLRPDLITIGDGCVITSGVMIVSHFMCPEDDTMYWGKVVIGNNVFIGMNALIVQSVSIGDNAVIGAGSVVTKDIPSGEVWGGVPAKFIKKVQ